MINHFKAEFYKLFRSKIMIAILGVCVALVMVSFALGDMTFFGAGDGTESVIGFQAKCYLSSEMPTFQTVARSSLAYTAFFWIVSTTSNVVVQLIYNTDSVQLCIKNPIATIPTEEYSKLLERFYVADISRSNGTSGQGLYIVKKLLLLMNCKNPIIEIQDHIFKITIDFSPLLIKK